MWLHTLLFTRTVGLPTRTRIYLSLVVWSSPDVTGAGCTRCRAQFGLITTYCYLHVRTGSCLVRYRIYLSVANTPLASLQRAVALHTAHRYDTCRHNVLLRYPASRSCPDTRRVFCRLTRGYDTVWYISLFCGLFADIACYNDTRTHPQRCDMVALRLLRIC